ncbi:MAG: PEGA domain-containing protein [Deltaproteobacteria bacterium]|nr:PEGA domain-containing protein [Deltaproteobacteria bacterium]
MRSLILALSLLLVLAHSAAAARPRNVVLAPFSALGITPKEAQRVRRWVMSAAASMPRLRFRQAKGLERRLGRRPACLADARCVARLAKKLRLGAVLVGDVGSIGGANIVYLQLLMGGKVRARESAVLDPRRGLRAGVRSLLYKLLLPRRYTGAVHIHSNIADSWVYLDGRRVGRGKDIKLSVRVGRHALRVTHPAHRDFVRFIEVVFRRRVSIQATLEPIAVQSYRMRYLVGKPLTDSELPWYRRWWAVAAVGSVLFATATVLVAVLPQDVDRDHAVTVIPSR